MGASIDAGLSTPSWRRGDPVSVEGRLPPAENGTSRVKPGYNALTGRWPRLSRPISLARRRPTAIR
jgi:hypothetical protein